jgi:DNA-binding NtrC family response regulator
MAKVLIADDEHAICEAFSDMLRADGHSPVIASSGEEALEKVAQVGPDVVFLDVQMPGMSGMEVLERLHGSHPALPIIVMTAYGTLQTAMDALRLKAFDYLGKPIDLARIRALLQRALHEPSTAIAATAMSSAPDGERMVGRSAAMQEVFKRMGMLTGNDLTVLITGESGVGKEVVASGIHEHGGRREHPFVAVNCAAIPEQLIESELFGHERGAFTDARELRRGRFEAAGAGSLFLDEISELPYTLQSKLLRVLQERTFERVGSVTPIPFKARLMAASNRDLAEEVKAGRFREDLYHRLNIVVLTIPPLRERSEDIEALALHFLQRANREIGRDLRGIEPAALVRLKTYSWPGNVRELEHSIKRSVLMARGPFLAAHDLDLVDQGTAPEQSNAESVLRAAIRGALRARLAMGEADAGVFADLVQLTEEELVAEALAITGDNQVAASKLLGLNRTTLRKRVRDE